MAAGWLDARSSVLTGVAVTLAMIAATVVAVYLLGPVGTSMWVNAVVGVLVLAGPLVTRPPLTHQRLGVTAVFWFCVGLPGGYVFGTSVFYAGVLLGAALLIDLAVACRSPKAPAYQDPASSAEISDACPCRFVRVDPRVSARRVGA